MTASVVTRASPGSAGLAIRVKGRAGSAETWARIAFGSLFLTVINPDGTLNRIGRVGSGFTLAETLTIKGELDTARAVGDLPIVEIECLGISRDGKLRQPVFVGWRTDQSIADAVTARLATCHLTIRSGRRARRT